MDNKSEQVLARELRAEQHKDEQEHKDTCKQTNRYTKLIAWSLFLIVMTYGITAFLGKTSGLPIAYSGDSIDGLRDKNAQNKEAKRFLLGLVYDNKEYLNDSKLVVRIRPDGTARGGDFAKDLSTEEKAVFINSAFDMEHLNVLEWITEQPNWKDGLNKDLINLVLRGPQRYETYTGLRWKQKYYDMKKHHQEQEHDDDYKLLDEAENKIEELEKELKDKSQISEANDERFAISQSKLNLMLAWYHNDPKFLDKVNWVHIDEKWEKAYELRLKEAPKVEQVLFEQKTKTATKKNLKNNVLH